MMRTQNYFVFAVMIAIIVPVAMGSIYFISMYNKIGSEKYLSSLSSKKEILILGDIELGSIQNTRNNPHVSDLVVKYTYGENDISDYNIYLDDVKIATDIDPIKIKWELYMLDEDDSKYLEIKFGNMEDLLNGKINISPNLQIGKNKTQRFRLCYYYNSTELDKRVDFSAKVILE